MEDRLAILRRVASGELSPDEADLLLTPPGKPDGWFSTNWDTVRMLLDLHEEYDLFYHLAAAFRICRDEGYGIPDELLHRLDGHFKRLLAAKNKREEIAALGFGIGTKGSGAGQGESAGTLFNQQDVKGLVDQAVGLGLSKGNAFLWVAGHVGTTKGAVKTMYHTGSRRQKPKR